MKLTRRKIREVAFQTLFAMNANPTVNKEQLMTALSGTKDIPEYLDQLVNGVLSKTNDIDNQIQRYLQSDWSIERIPKTDLIILRLGIFEIYNIDNVPNKVAINEALELAKEYSDDRSRRFINGILSNQI